MSDLLEEFERDAGVILLFANFLRTLYNCGRITLHSNNVAMSLSTLGQVIDLIQSKESWQHHRQFLQIVEHWPHVVGESVAQQTRPSGVYRQVLQVAVSSSVWSQALVFERRRILAKLNPMLVGSAPPLADIHFSTAKWSSLPNQTTNKAGLGAVKASEPSELMQQHPSFMQSPRSMPQANANQPTTALEAFQRWSNAVKHSTAHLPKCPCCSCATPSGELSRWQMCRTCARHEFLYFNTSGEDAPKSLPKQLPSNLPSNMR
jgi:predicted nucleic acid-binding Zn ribbon protein